MALVDIEGSDSWLTEYDACEKLFREIMEQLTSRDRQPSRQHTYSSLSADIRLRMNQYGTQVRQLNKKLTEASKQRTITAEEAERRMRQVELLQSRDVQLQKLYDTRTRDFAQSRADLLKSESAFADAGVVDWGVDDDDDRPIDVTITVDELRAQQQDMLQDQEKGLEELHKVILRQKEIGQTISSEVEHQNEIIDDLADHMDRTEERLINRTKSVTTIQRKDATCCYWVIILLLFISIVVVALV